jgi:hypothetical protein
MSLGLAAGYFLIGYTLAAICLIIVARFHDESWTSGFVMLGLSLPVTVVYFCGLWLLGHCHSLSPTVLAMIIVGVLSATYPAFCGFFPVYFVRLKFAIPLIALQFGTLLIIVAVLRRISAK